MSFNRVLIGFGLRLAGAFWSDLRFCRTFFKWNQPTLHLQMSMSGSSRGRCCRRSPPSTLAELCPSGFGQGSSSCNSLCSCMCADHVSILMGFHGKTCYIRGLSSIKQWFCSLLIFCSGLPVSLLRKTTNRFKLRSVDRRQKHRGRISFLILSHTSLQTLPLHSI